MAKKEPDPKDISMKNTKAEMIDAYNEVLELLKEKRAAELKPERIIEEKKVQEVVEVADSLSTEGIAREVSTLRLEMGRLLSDLSDKLEEEVNKYRQVKQAVQVRERELQEIYDIEKSALSLAALIEAQHQRRQQTEDDLAARKAELTLEIETLRAQWQSEKETERAAWQLEKETHAAAIKERDGAEQKERARQQEEYTYTFQREQQLAGERFEDEQARLERELANRREQMEKELADREKAVVEQENELRELRQRVSAFPAELETAVATAVQEATQRVEAQASSGEALLRKEFDGERNVLQARTESLQKSVAEQSEQIARLSQQVEKAYSQVQDIATKAIEGASHTQTVSNLQQLMAEQSRKKSPEA